MLRNLAHGHPPCSVVLISQINGVCMAIVRKRLATAIHALLLCGASVGCGDTSGGKVDAGSGPVSSDAGATSDASDAGDSGSSGSIMDPANWVEPTRESLPAAPTWSPEFPVAGAVGWRSSSVPVCNEDTGTVDGTRVFFVDNIVYLYATIYNNPFDASKPGSGRPSGRAVYANGGSGWNRRFWAPFDIGTQADSGLIATTSGDIFLSNFGVQDGMMCGVTRVEAGPLSASGVQCALLGDGGAVDLFLVGPDHPYAVTPSAIMSYGAAGWAKVVDLPAGQPAALWTDGTVTAVAGANQTAFLYDGVSLNNQTNNVPLGDYTSVWGFGANDVWFGSTSGNLVRFNGTSWSARATGITGCPSSPVVALWGHGSILYFMTERAFGRWNGSAMERFVDLPCSGQTRFRDMWGSDDGASVFITLEDTNYVNYQCGSVFAIWFDGAQFRRF